MLPDDDGFVPSSSSTNDTLFFDLPLFSFSCENFDKVCFAPTEWATIILISKLRYILIFKLSHFLQKLYQPCPGITFATFTCNDESYFIEVNFIL